jgi:hypothetical protein
MKIEDYFTVEYIVSNLAKYEMYYHVTMGKLISHTHKKQSEVNIEFQLALGSIYEMLKQIESLPNKDKIFENELKKQSAMDAVQEFVNENLEHIKTGEIQIEAFINEINENTFFTPAMEEVCSNNLYTQIGKWEGIITAEIAQAIMVSLKELEANV